MITIRRINSNHLNTQAQFAGAIRTAILGTLFAVCFVGVVQAQVVDVWPTGDSVQDRANVLDAIDLGGTVVLHAKNKSGTPTAFNIEDIWIWKDVTVRGETLPGNVTFMTPLGQISSDRAVVFCHPGYYGAGGKLGFAVGDGAVVIEDLRFDSYYRTAIHVQRCSIGGVVMRNNVITHLLRPNNKQYGIEVFGFGIEGAITIESNEITDAKTSILARQTADLYISGNTIDKAQNGIDIRAAADVYISSNTVNDVKNTGIWTEWTAGLNISGNLVHNAKTCVDVRNVSNGSITDNTITGTMQRGIFLNSTSDAVVSNNIIDRVVSPPSHPWWNGAVAIDYGANNIIRSNQIMGEGRSAVHLFRTHNNSVLDNDCSGYTGKWSDPGQSWNVCQFWDSGYSSGNTVSGNIWGPVAPESTLATVVVSFRNGASPRDDNVMDNNYRQYNNVPGWTEANPDGPGCVLLTEGTENNFVFESGHFPRDTDAKSQVMDLGINNRVVGHDADNVISPGIGQRLQQIQALIDALSAEEVEEQEPGEGIALEG